MAAAAQLWSGRRVLVTGAGGFIGSHLVEMLVRRGANVRGFVRYNSRNDYGFLDHLASDVREAVEVFRGDLCNPEAVANAVEGCAWIFHLGALIPIPYSFKHPREFVQANLVGTLNVLEASRRFGIERFVHTSTSEVYGTAQQVPITEAHPLHPQSPYAATKVGADQLALSFQRAFGLPVTVVRPFNTYGPRQSARAVIPTVIIQALVGETIQLGATSTTRDFVFVADTASGMIAAAEAPNVEGGVFNLSTGIEHTIADVVVAVAESLDKELVTSTQPERLRPRDSEVERLVGDGSHARAVLGWRPEVHFAEGIADTVAWISASQEQYKSEIYNV
jgi:NAD dependent epimerase/dehydratase